MKQSEVVFISYDDALDLVDRIADRTENFNYTMSKPEKQAMAQLLSDTGVKVSSLININDMADNYAINAEIVTPEEVDDYDRSDLADALFQWEEEDGTHYCLRW
jgi:hypothetical protein